MTDLRPFHLAIPVNDLAAARAFYAGALGCAEGRSASQWIDFDMGGHQLVVHHVVGHRGVAADLPAMSRDSVASDSGQSSALGGVTQSNMVDGHDIPVPHFGIVLTPAQFAVLADRIAASEAAFIHPPMVRFAGLPGEQQTMFLSDPSGNALEFKAFANDAMLFAAHKPA